MRILLLTSSLGSGHSRTGEAIEHALLERDPATRIRQIDFWSLMDQGVASAVKEAYLELVTRHPDLYDNLYRYDRHDWRRLLAAGNMPDPVKALAQDWRSRRVMGATQGLSPHCGLPDRALFTFLLESLAGLRHFPGGKVFRREILKWIPWRLARRLLAEVLRFSPDVIVATQMHPAALLSGLGRWRGTGSSVVVAVLTDYGVHDLWVQQRTGHYCVPTEGAAGDLIARGIPAHRIHITGIPLMPGFRRLPSCTQARQELGLDPVRPTLLVAGGGLGFGLYKVVEDLIRHEPSWQVLVATGRNSVALELLGPLATEAPGQVRLFGWTDRMDILMRAADVVVAKPGGLTLAEALACGRPLIAPCSLGGQGQEGFNVRFLERHGVGGPVPEGQLVESLRSLLSDTRKLATIQNRAWRLSRRDSAERVADLVCELVNSEARGRRQG
ncbi:MAG: hypothetical protein L6300_14705 [Syntrophaceae bacterium]|nr:hypothetical protein [Syntrophaceae bacterium]